MEVEGVAVWLDIRASHFPKVDKAGGAWSTTLENASTVFERHHRYRP